MLIMKFVKSFCLAAIVICVCFGFVGCGAGTTEKPEFASKITISKIAVTNVQALTTDEELFPTTITAAADKHFLVAEVKMSNTTRQTIYIDDTRIKLSNLYTISDKITVAFGTFGIDGKFCFSWNTTIASGTDKTMLFVFETPNTVTSGALSMKFQVQGGNGDVTKELAI
jgi:hypothetical protein